MGNTDGRKRLEAVHQLDSAALSQSADTANIYHPDITHRKARVLEIYLNTVFGPLDTGCLRRTVLPQGAGVESRN